MLHALKQPSNVYPSHYICLWHSLVTKKNMVLNYYLSNNILLHAYSVLISYHQAIEWLLKLSLLFTFFFYCFRFSQILTKTYQCGCGFTSSTVIVTILIHPCNIFSMLLMTSSGNGPE